MLSEIEGKEPQFGQDIKEIALLPHLMVELITVHSIPDHPSRVVSIELEYMHTCGNEHCPSNSQCMTRIVYICWSHLVETIFL